MVETVASGLTKPVYHQSVMSPFRPRDYLFIGTDADYGHVPADARATRKSGGNFVEPFEYISFESLSRQLVSPYNPKKG